MISRILLLFFLLNSLPLTAQPPTLHQVRLLFFEIEKDRDACKRMITMLEPFNENNDPVLLGYKGIATIIMAKHLGNPISKFSHFNRGKGYLEKAIKKLPNSCELIYLRFAVQTNIPSFLGYHKEVKKDEAFLKKNVPFLEDEDLKLHILDYLKYVDKHDKTNIK